MLKRRGAINLGVSPNGPAAPAIGGGRRLLWSIEERLVWGGADALRAVADVIRWPFERVAWATEERLVWPLQERAAGLSSPLRALAVVLAGVAVAAATLGVLRASDGGGATAPEPIVAQQVTSVQPTPQPAPAPEPVLQGAIPDFTPPAAAEVSDANAVAAGSSGAAATSSAAKPEAVSPGEAALRTAHRFAGAFVLYETGETGEKVRATFRATATPKLAKALLQRPPRLPAGAKVPKAKVLNIVPGPVEAGVHTVSVSLLRLGLTSELRLDIERNRKTDKWQVTDVLG